MAFSTKNSNGYNVRSNDLLSFKSKLDPKIMKNIDFKNPDKLKLTNILSLYKLGRSIAGEDGKYLGNRKDENSPYTWISYGEFNEMASAYAAGMNSLGIKSGNNVRVAVYCRMSNAVYAFINAAIKRRNVIVPVYDTLGMTSIEHIIEEASPNVVFCDIERYVESLLEIPCFQTTHIFVPFLITTELQRKADARGVIMLTVDDLKKVGQPNKDDFLELEDGTPDELVYIMYSSGSTGVPKGVQLTHKQFVFAVLSVLRQMTCEDMFVTTDDLVYYSYLPFQHSLENIALLIVTTSGGRIGISQGNLKLMASELNALKPTLFTAVPRVLGRFRERIMESVEGSNFLSRSVFNWNLNRRRAQLEKNDQIQMGFIDNVIFRKIHAIFGGNLKYMIVGGAPMARDLEVFSRVVLGVQLMLGYGLTETMAVTTLQSVGNGGLGNCGAPIAGIEVKLTDVPELGYFSANGTGEICIRGPNITPGYYKKPELTKEAFDDEGFFRSGDIGSLNADGTFTIIDRCKNIFKLAQGEYIMAEKIEQIYSNHPLVKQIMLYGDSTKDYCLAVIIVNMEYLTKFAKGLHTNGHSGTALLENKDVRAKLLSELTAIGKKANLFGFEQIREFVLDLNEFTTANEFLTPTMKIRRPIVTRFYYDRLQALYNK